MIRLILIIYLLFITPNIISIESEFSKLEKEKPSVVNKPSKEYIRYAKFISALIEVESKWNPDALNKKEDAVGLLQIRPVMLDDVNRILRINENKRQYKLSDRWDLEKSLEIFKIYTDYYSKDSDFETIARRWNGGPIGDEKKSTIRYWKKINKLIRSKYANYNS